jgi:predicted permease
VSVNGVVLAFALGISMLTAVGFGLAPALLLSRTRLRDALRRDSRADGGAAAGGRTHSFLVAAEVALAVILLSGAGLLIRSVVQLLRVDSGVNAERVVTADLQLSNAQYGSFVDIARFYGRLSENLRQNPMISAAGVSNFLPLESGWGLPFDYPGASTEPGRTPIAQFHSVDEGWFDALGVPLVGGRAFDARDDSARPGVVIVNEAAVERFWPGEDVIGKRILYNPGPIGPLGRAIIASTEYEIIGVTSDVRNASLSSEPEPAIYFTQRQFPFRNMHVYVRGSGDASTLLAALREEVRRLDPGIPLAHPQTLDRVLAAPADPPRLVMFVLLVFAALALILAAIGIYGILSYVVTSRGREIGIRMALGARPPEVLAMVLRQGLMLGVSGSILGVLGAMAAGRLLSGLLFGVRPADPATLATVFALANLIAVLACLVPGRRAASTQPMRALRAE